MRLIVAVGFVVVVVILAVYALAYHRWYAPQHVGRWMAVTGSGPIEPGLLMVGRGRMQALDWAFLPATCVEALGRGAELRIARAAGQQVLIERRR